MAMIEAYRIGVNLVLGGDLAEGIEALIPGFETLDKSVTHANAEAKGLAASLRGVGASAGGINGAADAMSRLAEAMATMNRAAGAWRAAGGMPQFEVPRSPGQSGSRRDPILRLPAGPIPNVPEPPMSGPRAPRTALVPSTAPNFTFPGPGVIPEPDAPFHEEGERLPPIRLNPNGRPRGAEQEGDRHSARGGHVHGAFDAVIPALMGGEALKSIFGASFEIGAKEAGLLNSGWTPEQVAKARALAQATQVATPGVTIGGALEVMSDLGTIIRNPDGSPNAAGVMQLLPSYARDALLLSHGKGDGVSELFKAAQSADMKGALTVPGTEDIDPEKFSAFVHNVVLADIVSGHRIPPSKILANMKAGGASAAMMDDKEYFGANLALIDALGGPISGTALQAFNRQFGSMKMAKGTAMNLIDLYPGLANNIESNGPGQVIIHGAAFGPVEEIATKPFKYVHDELIPRLDNALRKTHSDFDTMTPQNKLVLETQEAARLSTVTGARFFGEIMRLYPQMERWQTAFEAAQKTDPYTTAQANNPELKAKGLSAAWNAFEVSLGEAGQEPAIAALNSMTGWLNGIAAWSKANPDGAKLALEGLAGGIALFGVASVAGMAMAAMTNPVTGFVALAFGLAAVAKILPDTTAAILKFATLNPLAHTDTPEEQRHFQEHPLQQGPHIGVFGNNPDGSPKTIGQSLRSLLHLDSYRPDGSALSPLTHNIAYTRRSEMENYYDVGHWSRADTGKLKAALQGLSLDALDRAVPQARTGLSASGGWGGLYEFADGITAVGKALDTLPRGGAGLATPLHGYHPDPDAMSLLQPIHITFEADGRELSHIVTRHQLRMMGGNVSGTLRPDPSIAPQYGAHLIET